MAAPSPVFIAGTGRCGTSQLADIIGEHPAVRRIPMETHFLVDPGGVRDYADAATVRYDPISAQDALLRLRQMLSVLTPHRVDRDRGYSVPEAIGEQHYWDAVDALWPQLVACTFQSDGERRVLPRYFADRSELVAILRGMVDTMFGGAATTAGKPTWAEKTPFNLLAMDFLWELYPHATIVHVKRHPLAVVASHLDQPWAPHTVDGVLAWLLPVYDRWLAWKSTHDVDGQRYVEVKAEDLAADWPEERRSLFERLGLEDTVTSSTFEARVLNARDNRLDAHARAHAEEALEHIIPAMGY